jgi:ribosomal protein S18 acetylase RimI-like enzyme
MQQEFNIDFRFANSNDLLGIFTLYQQVSIQKDTLARNYHEITKDYIQQFSREAQNNGLQFIAVDLKSNIIIGEIHTYHLFPIAFSHTLSNLTIAVHPNYQGKGIGRKLFSTLLSYIENNQPQILRVELIARSGNINAQKLYKFLNFVQEGVMEKRIKNTDGSFDNDILMAWFNKNFKG